MVQRHDDPRGEPNWQPVTAVTMMAGMLTGQLAANREQLELLERARREPWLLDDATVDRVKEVFGVQRDDMWLWEENGRRWQALDLDTATRAQAGGYMSLAAQFATTSTEVLALAGEIAGGTISKVMAKSDLELDTLAVPMTPFLSARSRARQPHGRRPERTVVAESATGAPQAGGIATRGQRRSCSGTTCRFSSAAAAPSGLRSLADSRQRARGTIQRKNNV